MAAGHVLAVPPPAQRHVQPLPRVVDALLRTALCRRIQRKLAERLPVLRTAATRRGGMRTHAPEHLDFSA